MPKPTANNSISDAAALALVMEMMAIPGRSGEEVAIKFGDQVTRQAVIEGAASPAKPARAKPRPAAPPQGDLF